MKSSSTSPDGLYKEFYIVCDDTNKVGFFVPVVTNDVKLMHRIINIFYGQFCQTYGLYY